MIKKRVEMDDAEAIYNLGCCYAKGGYSMPQDFTKALDLWHRAGKLGNAKAYYSVGASYYHGRGVERDAKKAKHFCQLAAIGGQVKASTTLASLRGGQGI